MIDGEIRARRQTLTTGDWEYIVCRDGLPWRVELDKRVMVETGRGGKKTSSPVSF
jgi:hypothetical protein